MDDPVSLLYFEKQDGALCAKHCINTLLQGHYFTVTDLASIANGLDDTEDDYGGHGSNLDDSGDFSIQVIMAALEVYGLSLASLASESEAATRLHPETESAYICHLKHHWFTLRRFGNYWANLNSQLKSPKFMTKSELVSALAAIQGNEGTTFVVRGTLPTNRNAEKISSLPPSAFVFKAQGKNISGSSQISQVGSNVHKLNTTSDEADDEQNDGDSFENQRGLAKKSSSSSSSASDGKKSQIFSGTGNRLVQPIDLSNFDFNNEDDQIAAAIALSQEEDRKAKQNDKEYMRAMRLQRFQTAPP